MSDIMEKTIASLPNLLSGSLTGNKPNSSSRAFQTFIRNLGNLKSRYEEESFMKRELSLQKQRLGQPGITSGQTREYLVRLVYCSMLGYDVSFAYIHAIKLAQQGALIDKRAGYLVTAMFLKDSDELVMLLVNTIQKDLRSTNVACMSMALTAAAQLISQEMVPALLPLVEEKLKHPREMVRKKAVLCLLAFYAKAPDLLAHGQHRVEAALCDPDPGVMWAALLYYHQLVKVDPTSYTHLVPTLLGLLDQVVNRRLSSDYEYHSVPAPWLQILLLKVLARLGHNSESTSQLMYPILRDVLQRTEPSHKIGLAVIYECLVTILSIWPQPALVEHAAKVVGKFLSSKNNNLRYLGIKALTMVVRINPGYAMEHQEAVLDCLEHCDLTIRTREEGSGPDSFLGLTLDLLYQMANPQNRHVVSERLLHQLSTCPDAASRVDVVTKVVALADRFATDRTWFIETVNRAVLLGGPAALPTGIPEKVVAVIPKRTETSEDSKAVHKFCVQTFWTLLHQDDVPDVLLQVAAWVMGELCSVVGDLDLSRVVRQLTEVYLRAESSDQCRAAVLSALIKLSCDTLIPADQLEALSRVIQPEQVELRQRFVELERVNSLHCDQRVMNTLNTVLNEAVKEQDWSLSFLDNFVAERLEEGAPPYKPAYIRLPMPVDKNREGGSLFVGLNFTPYESPAVTGSVVTTSTVHAGNGRTPGSDGLSQLTESTLTNLQLSGVKRVWTKEGVVSSPEKVDLSPPREVNLPSTEEKEGGDEESEGTDPTDSLQGDADARRRQQMAQLFSGIVDIRTSTSETVTSPDEPQ